MKTPLRTTSWCASPSRREREECANLHTAVAMQNEAHLFPHQAVPQWPIRPPPPLTGCQFTPQGPQPRGWVSKLCTQRRRSASPGIESRPATGIAHIAGCPTITQLSVTKKGNPGSLEHPPPQLMSRGGLVNNHLWGQILDPKKVHVYYPNTSKLAMGIMTTDSFYSHKETLVLNKCSALPPIV